MTLCKLKNKRQTFKMEGKVVSLLEKIKNLTIAHLKISK